MLRAPGAAPRTVRAMTISRSLLRFRPLPSRTAQREALISRLAQRVLALREELDAEQGRVAELEEIVALLKSGPVSAVHRRTRPAPSAVTSPVVDVPGEVLLTDWWRDVRQQGTGEPAWDLWTQANGVPLPERYHLCARFYDEWLRLSPEERQYVLLPRRSWVAPGKAI